jgi:4-amino-4-deoxy-L-arabinose transferase-like glycosyltransferase
MSFNAFGSIQFGPPQNKPSVRSIWLLALILAAVWFANLETRKLVRPDEGRYAVVPLEMVRTGDWVTPRENGLKYFEKPAFQYWATAAAYEVFGVAHWTSRLWPALSGFLGVLLVGLVGARFWGLQTGVLAAAVAASSPLYSLIAHVNTLDMGVTFFLNLGMLSLMLAQRGSISGSGSTTGTTVSSNARRNWMWLAWAALGFAVLSKGLIGAALPAAALIVYTLWSRDWALWKRMHFFSGLLIFFAVSVPWFVAVSLRNPEFFQFFFIHEHFERFLTKTHSRVGPPWYFVPILLAGMMPWTFLMFDAGARAFRRESGAGFQPKRFLLAWSLFVFMFFSASGSKLPSYILPIFPALALLIGEYLSRISARALAWHIVPALILCTAASFFAPQATRLADAEVPLALYQGYVPWLIGAAACATAGAALALWFALKSRTLPAVVSMAFGALLAAQAALTGHDNLSPASSTYHLVKQIGPYLKPGLDANGKPLLPFYSISLFDQTLPFYINRSVTLVEYTGELSFGIEQEPGSFLKTYGEFEQQWRAAPDALAIMHPGTLVYFNTHKVPYTILARDTRRVIVRNH